MTRAGAGTIVLTQTDAVKTSDLADSIAEAGPAPAKRNRHPAFQHGGVRFARGAAR